MILVSQGCCKENEFRLPESWDCLLHPLRDSDPGLNEVLYTWKYLKVWDNQMPFDNPRITPLWGFTFSAQSSWCSSGQHTELQALQTAESPAVGQVSSAACCNSQSPWEEVPGTSSRPSLLTAPRPSWRETAEVSPVHKCWGQGNKMLTCISEHFRSYLNLGDCTWLKTASQALLWFVFVRKEQAKSCFPEHSRKQTRMTSLTASTFSPATVSSGTLPALSITAPTHVQLLLLSAFAWWYSLFLWSCLSLTNTTLTKQLSEKHFSPHTIIRRLYLLLAWLGGVCCHFNICFCKKRFALLWRYRERLT